MSLQVLRINSLTEIDMVAAQFLEITKDHRLFAFYGEMGVGKTTFIKALCKLLDVVDEVTSPTFAIVNEYSTKTEVRVFHFDFYRIKKESEILDFGYEEYFYGNDYCMIEWPELAEGFLPDNILKIFLEQDPTGSRVVKF